MLETLIGSLLGGVFPGPGGNQVTNIAGLTTTSSGFNRKFVSIFAN